MVYLQTTIDKQVARTQRDKRRPLLQKDDPETVLRNLAEQRNPLYEDVARLYCRYRRSKCTSCG